MKAGRVATAPHLHNLCLNWTGVFSHWFVVVPRPVSGLGIQQDKTRDFMRICEKSGAEAITVHLRLRDERPAEPAHWDEMARVWDAVKAPEAPGVEMGNCNPYDI